MTTFVNARFATLLALGLVVLLSGVVVGAAGGPLIMGALNNAEASNTTLSTNSTGTALLVQQNGTGTALRGLANNGIAGFFTSFNGSGVSGVVAATTKYGVYGGNDAASFGGGAAVRADGKQNHGVVATTANLLARALRAINTGGGPALDLVVNAGVAPMTVNSDTVVANLNADLLDGLDSTDLQARVTGTCAAGSMVTGVNADGTVTCETDDDTTYTGAHPIEVSADTIGLSTDRCDTGHVYKLADEAWACAPDAIDGGDAATLDGLDSTAFAAAQAEAWNEVSALQLSECNPVTHARWTNVDALHNTAAYYKDPFGVVHLKGMVRCVGGLFVQDTRIFVLPASYQPAKRDVHTTLAGDALARVDIDPDGSVTLKVGQVGAESYLRLDGITFRAAS